MTFERAFLNTSRSEQRQNKTEGSHHHQDKLIQWDDSANRRSKSFKWAPLYCEKKLRVLCLGDRGKDLSFSFELGLRLIFFFKGFVFLGIVSRANEISCSKRRRTAAKVVMTTGSFLKKSSERCFRFVARTVNHRLQLPCKKIFSLLVLQKCWWQHLQVKSISTLLL